MRLAQLTLALALAATASSAQDEPRDETWLIETARNAFFHVSVTGTQADAPRWGKAFAIGPDLLLTANHVLGDASEWQADLSAPAEIARAARPILRTIALQGTDGEAITDLIVIPAFSPAIDAATITAPGLSLGPESVFQLSLCPVEAGKAYTALLTAADPPNGARSSEAPAAVKLIARGYEPARYGGLYVFETDPPLGFSPEPWGHDGSPIFDAEFNVVALVAAVTVEGGAARILATPIQPLIPGTTLLLSHDYRLSEGRPKCSVADVVSRIDHQVETHAIWSVVPERENGDYTGRIVFSYQSVSERPNIERITVRYEFWGREEADLDETRIAVRNSSEDVVEISQPGSRLDRDFADHEILKAGRELFEPHVADGGGAITRVRFVIKPDYTSDQRPRSEPFEIEVPWSLLNGE
jgi:hypothetical protein